MPPKGVHDSPPEHAPACYSWEALLCQEKLGRTQSVAHCSLFTADCSLLTAHCSLLAAPCLLLAVHSSPLTAHGSSLAAHCSLISAHCSLLTVYCLLHTVHCSSLATHCNCSLRASQSVMEVLPVLSAILYTSVQRLSKSRVPDGRYNLTEVGAHSAKKHCKTHIKKAVFSYSEKTLRSLIRLRSISPNGF